jgi:hypothetical protein
MKECEGVKVQLHSLLISAVDGSKLSASWPSRFTPLRKSLRYSLKRRRYGPQSWCAHFGGEKNLSLPETEPRFDKGTSLVAISTTTSNSMHSSSIDNFLASTYALFVRVKLHVPFGLSMKLRVPLVSV